MRCSLWIVGLSLFVATAAAPVSASAQFISLRGRVSIRSILTVTVTQGGSVRCHEPANFPSENVFLLAPEIGARDSGHRQIWCGDVRIGIDQTLEVTHIERLQNSIRPDYAKVFTTITVTYANGFTNLLAHG